MNLTKSLTRVSLITGALLLVPLLAMQFTAEVNWSPFDFVVMGALLFSVGMALELVASQRGPVVYRLAAAGAILTTLLLVWSNLAVGFIGSGPNAANLLCGAVPLLALGGAFMVRFQAHGMAYAMVAAALLQLLVPVLALLVSHLEVKPQEWGISVVFAAFWLGSAWLFQRADTSNGALKQRLA
ncbi:hypothetical protein [Hymenobacter jeollabukensis]|uniref:Uncharacterized protein n=1 Tax=Hymenobacter jeollabukensis TaxID=2025313 RepID=A0A5R8WSC3_9BACT|nr:hypothetical protein [Hymenobacter jeollabukensis]TLM93343.1 hypothetical protein FDY95_12065 [Hymenobacter jeollabukensis]